VVKQREVAVAALVLEADPAAAAQRNSSG